MKQNPAPMKKPYVKPEAHLVDFTLSSSIAADCNLQANYAENSCSAAVLTRNGWTVYDHSFACDYRVDKNVCYHVPTANLSIFTS